MVTAAATPVNGTTPRVLMLSIAALAERDGVKKSGVSRRVKQLRANGLHVELDGLGRVALVNSVQYDEMRKRYDDPSKAQAPKAPAPQLEGANETYDEARRVLTWTEAERAKLKLEAEQKLYVKVEELEAAVDSIGEAIVEIVDRLPMSADDLAAAVARDGVAGLRTALKKMAHEWRTEIADAMAMLANREET